MNTNVKSNTAVQNRGVGGTISITPPNVGFTSDVLPEVQDLSKDENSHTGVSTKNAPEQNNSPERIKKDSDDRHWYVLRTTYGREQKAYTYVTNLGLKAFLPTISKQKEIKGKKKLVTTSLLNNILFVYETEEELRKFVFNNKDLPFLRFYYDKCTDKRIEPLVVPDRQMHSFMIICNASDKDTIFTSEKIQKFKIGQEVAVTKGDFAGVKGIVARYFGQQRVGLQINGIGTIITAYVPTSFLCKL